jgi:dTDP-4-amino-4,6-dideoxy-D-galactose acyltransferase
MLEALNALEQARHDNYELIYLYCQQTLELNGIDGFNGLDVGGQITFEKELVGNVTETCVLPDKISRVDLSVLSNPLIELAFISGNLSRFKVDSSLPEQSFERLYRQWLINGLEGKDAAVLIYGSQLHPDGMITAEWDADRCYIGLLAVRPDQQGSGLGGQLIKAIELESLRRGSIGIVVKTQIINQRACRFYSRNGYSEIACSNLYHFHRT